MFGTQKRHPSLITPSKSGQKGQCGIMTTQKCRIPGYPHSLHGAAGYGHSHLFAPVCHDPVSRDAWHLEKPSSPPPLLAGLHASPVPRAENLGRACPLDSGLDHGLALSPRAQGGLLEYPSAGGVVGAGSLQHPAPAQGRHTVSWGGWECETQAGDAASLGPKGAQKRASAVVLGGALRAADRYVGELSLPRGLSPDSAQNPSGVPHG